jgi:protein arginine N-methyltransferase 2
MPSEESIDELWTVNDLGENRLHQAAKENNLPLVTALLQAGIPWNSLTDTTNITAGELTTDEAIYDFLVMEGVRSELILSAFGTQTTEEISNSEYLDNPVVYTDDDALLLDSGKDGVMMEWESSIMQAHADVICKEEGLSVLNVGFGLGIIDGMLQEKKPKRHVIVEAHPDVYKHMIKNGWGEKEGVEIVLGRWQDHVESLGVFDGVFFDTFGEFYGDLKEFHDHVPNLLRDNTSVYSFFNGLAGSNRFFHDVYCQVAQLDLEDCGITTRYEKMDVPKEIMDEEV